MNFPAPDPERPFNDYDAERMVEPCEHGWVVTVCTDCGVVIGQPQMHPEEL